MAILKQAEMDLAVSGLIRQLVKSEQTSYRWKKRYGCPHSEQVRELKQLVEENSWLEKLVAELSLDKAVLQDVLSKNPKARAHEDINRLCDGVSRLQRAADLRINSPTSVYPTQAQHSRPKDCSSSKDA